MNNIKIDHKPHRRIPSIFNWMPASNLFTVQASLSDSDVLAFIASGAHEVEIRFSRKVVQLYSEIKGFDSFRIQLELAAWSPSLLRPTLSKIKKGAKVLAHCYGVFSLSDPDSVLLLIGAAPPVNSENWLSPCVVAEAAILNTAHLHEVAQFEEIIRIKKQQHEEFEVNFRRVSRDYEKTGESLTSFVRGLIASEDIHNRPKPRVDSLVKLLHKAVKFPVRSTTSEKRLKSRASLEVASANWPTSRDGQYEGIQSVDVNGKKLAVVYWEPYEGLPAYPEIRSTIQRRLSSALRVPRLTQPTRPEFKTGPLNDIEIGSVRGVSPDIAEALDDINLFDNDFINRVERIKGELTEHGFEAVAWFQPYHVWSESTWGIYFDASKLDDLALAFWHELREKNTHGQQSDAARIVFGLTYAHEHFHASVEAALSWLELNTLQPRYLRYSKQVYDLLRETPDWLEEALANWTSWSWFQSASMQNDLVQRGLKIEGIQKIVETWLDLSPPGYRDWRVGDQVKTWRKFSTQLVTGQPALTTSGNSLPLDSIIRGPFPYDLRNGDIPLRFVGSGVIADRLQSHPSTLNEISRRELQRALKFYDHEVDQSAGAGSHEKWTGKDNRAFSVPMRDPVSGKVFKSFLKYVDIDKYTYVHNIRPKL